MGIVNKEITVMGRSRSIENLNSTLKLRQKIYMMRSVNVVHE